MSTAHARASSGWLRLREPADAAARALELVEEVRPYLPRHGSVVVHDLGCGTGSMARWLATQLDGPQHWVMVDRDPELLAIAATCAPARAADGAPVTTETRHGDITRLPAAELGGAALITASALLDMMTSEELTRFVASCAAAGCPVLLMLSVTGQVDILPHDPFDEQVRVAFNGHQRRPTGHHRLLGPDAVGAAVDGFRHLGLDVVVRPSPWRLDAAQRALAARWFTGWLRAACEESPSLSPGAAAYARRRLNEASAGQLRVTVHHQDILVRPR